MGLLDRLAPRRSEPEPPAGSGGSNDALLFATKALRKFLTTLTSREIPVLLDIGPVVGSNVAFFGERLGCKIFVEDIFGELDRALREGATGALPARLQSRFPQGDGTVDGILCWDLFDYLERAAAHVLAAQLTRILRPEGVLLAFFGTAQPHEARCTKYIIVDEGTLRHRPYPASRSRQGALLNRDIIRLFPALRVSDSFLLKNKLREILFRKPA